MQAETKFVYQLEPFRAVLASGGSGIVGRHQFFLWCVNEMTPSSFHGLRPQGLTGPWWTAFSERVLFCILHARGQKHAKREASRKIDSRVRRIDLGPRLSFHSLSRFGGVNSSSRRLLLYFK